jgi:nitroreductase
MALKPMEVRERTHVNVLAAIRERRSVRAYTGRMVETELVHKLLDAAIHAPSALNQQPWAFVVVQDRSLLARIAERSRQLCLAHMQPGTPMWENRARFENPSFSVFYDASTLIVVCAAPGTGHVDEDCCLAAENLMLAAHALGLATCPIGLSREALNEPEMKRELAIPDDHSVVMPIIVGYPREYPPATARNPIRILSWK